MYVASLAAVSGICLRGNSIVDAQRFSKWQHDHVFAQDNKRAGEKRTLFVVAMTAVYLSGARMAVDREMASLGSANRWFALHKFRRLSL